MKLCLQTGDPISLLKRGSQGEHCTALCIIAHVDVAGKAVCMALGLC